MSNFNLGVVLNGPPGCGKDTIANHIVQLGKFVKRQFKDALYEHTAKHFQVDLDQLIHYASDRDLKDSVSLAGLGGRTPREALIYVSEKIYKPRHGDGYFGDYEARGVEEYTRRLAGNVDIIYPDGGFAGELLTVEQAFDALLIVRLHRVGFDFKGDSRNYVYLPDSAVRTSVDIHLTDDDIQSGVDAVLSNIHLLKEHYNVC